MTLHTPKPMRNFTLLWFGQVISTIGSYMTQFSVKIWLWDQTEQASTLTAMSLLSVLSGLVMAGVAGVLVDRWNRKGVLFASDGVAAGVTLGLLLLFWSGHLHLWHFYAGEIVQGAAGEVQFLAYASATAAMLPQQDYARASSMNAAIHYSAIIFAPAIAGVLYPQIGFGGIAMIDLATFGVGIATLLCTAIPSTASTSTDTPVSGIKQAVQSVNRAFDGFRYLLRHRGLFALLSVSLGFEFAHELGSALYTPMILARSQNDPAILGTVNAAAGLGGVLGALLLILWKGPRHRIMGYLYALIGIGASKIGFGMAQSLPLWIGTQCCSSLHFPLLSSCEMSIWWTQTSTELQGRVLAARSMGLQLGAVLAIALSGPLADHVFEPALQPGGILSPYLSRLFGRAPGAGIAALYTLSAAILLCVGLVGFLLPAVRTLEDRPHKSITTASS